MKITTITSSTSVGSSQLRARRLGHMGSVFLLLCALGVQAQQPPGYNQTTATVSVTNPGGNLFVTGPTYSQYNYPMVSGQNSGYAGLSGGGGATPAITSGAYANSSNGGWVSTSASYATAVRVHSGSSGLANGAPVTLQLSLQLDGTTSATSGDDAGYSYMSFDMRISAPDQAIYDPEKGWYEPTIMQFGAFADNNVDNFFTTFYGDPGGAWYHSTEYQSGWQWYSNTGDGNGGNADEYTVEPGQFTSTATRDFDTGVVLIDFQTFVGDTLNIFSFLNVYGDTYGAGSAAYADFLRTLQASLGSPGVDGLIFEFGAGSAIPVPPALWLFGSAMLGLIGLRKRQVS